METLRLTQRLRPLRLLFWISEVEEEQALFAFRLNCALWGGILNPVVSVEQGEDFLDSMFRASRADLGINLSDNQWPSSIVRQYEQRLRSLVEGRWGLLSREAGVYKFNLGCDMIPLFQDFWERHGRFRAFSSETRDRDFVVLTAVGNYWQKYATIVSGTYPGDFEHDYAARYTQATGSAEISLDEGALGSFSLLKAKTPLHFTLANLECRYATAGAVFDSHIIFIGDLGEVRHWLDFWNLRGCGSSALFVPWDKVSELATQIVEYVEAGFYLVDGAWQITALVQKASTLSNERFESAVSTIRELLPQKSPVTRRDWMPTFGLDITDLASKVHGPPPLESAICTAFEQEDLIPITGSHLEFKLVVPEFLVPFSTDFNRGWAVALSGRDPLETDLWINLPPFPAVARMLRTKHHLLLADSKVCPRENLVLIQDRGRASGFFLMSLPNTLEIFGAVLGQFGLKLTDYSEKGRYASAMERKMGGYWEGVQLLRDRGVRRLLERLAANEGRCALSREALANVIGKSSQLVRERHAPGRGMTPAIILDALIARGVLRPGLQFKCKHCYRQSWYDLSQIGTAFRCNYCFEEQPTPILDREKWRYRASGLFGTKDVGYGSLAVICTSLFFRSRFRLDVRHLYSFVFDDQEGNSGEVDLALLRMGVGMTTDMAFCECKSGKFCEKDFEKLGKLASTAHGAVVCAATLKESFNSDEKQWALDLWNANHKVILLAGPDLESTGFGLEGVEEAEAHFGTFAELASLTKVKHLS